MLVSNTCCHECITPYGRLKQRRCSLKARAPLSVSDLATRNVYGPTLISHVMFFKLIDVSV